MEIFRRFCRFENPRSSQRTRRLSIDDGSAKVFDIFANFSGNTGAKKKFEVGDLVAAFVSGIKSSKSKLSSRIVGRLKFLGGGGERENHR